MRILGMVCMMLVSSLMLAQGDLSTSNDGVPRVFALGDHQEAYQMLSDKYGLSLLAACENNMDKAFENWAHMILAMEDYASSIDYDINGVKLWTQVYWSQDGAVDHIAYYIKPNSRNVSRAELDAFFRSFVKDYRMPLKTPFNYTHYGSASFPLLGSIK